MKDILKSDDRFRYMMLGRFQSDCEYYLGFGHRNAEHALWAKDEKQHIQNMKDLHNSFPENGKPVWLTWEQILEYERQMTQPIDVGCGCTISAKWIPNDMRTNVRDINGNELMTSDKVKLNGCTSRFAYVGIDMSERFVLFFGSKNGSVSWNLNPDVVMKHKVEVVKEE